VNFALDTDQSTGCGQGDTVLTSACLGEDLGFAHVFGQQGLAQTVIDFVGACMIQIFTLQKDSGTTNLFQQSFGVKDGRHQ
jgi:hypothetical protein